MSRFEVLCVTMYQKDFSKIREMNIHSDVVFANQCDYTAYDEYFFEGHTAKMISTRTRGVGINRNLALSYASADICLLADDDIKYHDDMAERVIAEFDAHPDADVMIFHLEADDPVRIQPKYARTEKWSRFRGLPWGGVRIAFRLDAVRKANAWFSPLFGGGAVFPSGEDSLFLTDLRRAGLTIYVSKETIGSISFETSSWFTGRDEKYFFSRGAYFKAVHPKTTFLWVLFFALRVKKSNLTFSQKMKWMKHGKRAYKEMLSFENYKKKYQL
ncbi:MAG TPA: glycosyltransferase family A protein [Spirochaetia bacterium]|nr:glycosyltransferase family A protein [Spirochaetia bacterium]